MGGQSKRIFREVGMAFKPVSFYGPSQGVLTPARRAYQDDPRRLMAQQLIQQGSSTAPVQSPLEGIARALTAGVGGYFGGQAKREMMEREAAQSEAMMKALGGAQAKEFERPSPDFVGPMQGSPGGMQGVIEAGMATGNKDILPFLQQAQMQQMAQEQAAQQAEIAQRQGRENFLFEQANTYREGKPPKTVKTAEGVFILNPDGSLGTRLGGAKAETEINLGGELSKDFRPVKDPATGATIGAEPVPGGKEDPATIQTKKQAERQAALNVENIEKLPARRSQIYSAVQSAPAFESAVDDAIDLAKSWSTSGLAQQALGGIAGTDAFALERALDTIKSNIGFGELLRIKESGGTLGALSEMENRLLQAMQGALDPRLKGDKLAAALGRVKTIHKLNLEQKKREFKDMYPDSPRPWDAKGGGTGGEDDAILNKYAPR
jgi:hypothetical protein